MKIPCYHIDAFASAVFRGNPAAVCPLVAWLPDATLQNIAAENNLSETAFLVPRGADYDLRWFTPTIEVDLCGHATLAAAFVLATEHGIRANPIRFHSRSGVLAVLREGDLSTLDFPSRPAVPAPAPEALLRGLGARPAEVSKARDYLAVFASEAEVLALKPDFAALKMLDCLGIIAAAPGLRRAEVPAETLHSADDGARSEADSFPASATQAGLRGAEVPAETLRSADDGARSGVDSDPASATQAGLRHAEVPAETLCSGDDGVRSGPDSCPASATQAGGDCDFVSRFFAPGAGIDEDPATGSSHCTLIPYWAQRLGKTKLFARQVSPRGGEMFCELAGDRVLIGGKAVLYLRGEIEIQDARGS